MSSEAPRPRRWARLVPALLALALLAEALPIAAAAVARLPGDPVLRALRAGEPVAPAALDRLMASRRAALAWRERPADRAVLGLGHLVRAGRASGDAAPRLRHAEAALTAALRRAPGDPHAWTRLALVRARRGAPEAARAALALSRRVGPRVPELDAVRAALTAALSRGR